MCANVTSIFVNMYQYHPYAHTQQYAVDRAYRPMPEVLYMPVPHSTYDNRAYASRSTLPLHYTTPSASSYYYPPQYHDLTTLGYPRYDTQPVSSMTNSKKPPGSASTYNAKHDIVPAIPIKPGDVEIHALHSAGMLHNSEWATLTNHSPGNETARNALLKSLRDIGKIDKPSFEKMYKKH